MTPVEIAGVITGTKAAFETIRAIAQEVNKAQDAPEALQMTAAIGDLAAQLTEMQHAISELSRENDELRHQLEAPATLGLFKKQYDEEESVCWKRDAAGKRVGPFCPHCVDEGKESRLHVGATKGYYSCVTHKVSFQTAAFGPFSGDPIIRQGEF